MRILMVFLGILMASCASVQQYDGPKKSDAEVAIVEKSQQSLKKINLKKVNNRLKGVDTLGRYEFLPGTYVLTFFYTDTSTTLVTTMGRSVDLEVDLKAGHQYEIHHRLDEKANTWSIWILDKKSGKKVSRWKSKDN